MNTNACHKIVRTTALLAALCSLLFAGCTHTRVLNLRYTPLIQVQRLADKTNPQIVVVGEFNDTRPQTTLTQHRLNPINIHTFKYESKDDVSILVRNAFVDGLLKSGFEVPMLSEQGMNPLLNIAGKIVTYKADTKIGWNTITVTADVAVEVATTPKTGSPITFMLQGQSRQEQKMFMNVEAIVPDLLDRALQECVKKFLEDDRFRGLIKS